MVESTPKAGAMVPTEWIAKRDSLGGFHLRIAAFDAGWANAAAGQDINREKGWCAVRTLHNRSSPYNYRGIDAVQLQLEGRLVGLGELISDVGGDFGSGCLSSRRAAVHLSS